MEEEFNISKVMFVVIVQLETADKSSVSSLSHQYRICIQELLIDSYNEALDL